MSATPYFRVQRSRTSRQGGSLLNGHRRTGRDSKRLKVSRKGNAHTLARGKQSMRLLRTNWGCIEIGDSSPGFGYGNVQVRENRESVHVTVIGCGPRKNRRRSVLQRETSNPRCGLQREATATAPGEPHNADPRRLAATLTRVGVADVAAIHTAPVPVNVNDVPAGIYAPCGGWAVVATMLDAAFACAAL